jgi:hypothetical protein
VTSEDVTGLGHDTLSALEALSGTSVVTVTVALPVVHCTRWVAAFVHAEDTSGLISRQRAEHKEPVTGSN